jgi:hypothetical protein
MAHQYFDEKELLEPPVYRASYSDRTAWLMAEASLLAYEKYEPTEEYMDEIADIASRSMNLSATEFAKAFEHAQSSANSDGMQVLKDALESAGYELVRPISNKGTQGFLAKHKKHKIAILAFRGTEKNFGDIKTDLNARFYRDQSNSKIHSGFLMAYRDVKKQIASGLENLKDHSIYLTGHSLGGALAVIATRELAEDNNIAACYTFGSPKVGNSEFGDAIKPPIYRIVNAADMVPRLPPTWIIELLLLLCRVAPIPWFKESLVGFLKKFRGYSHHGDMRYLTACDSEYKDLRLIPNLNIIHRGMMLYRRLWATWFKAGALDHRITEYGNKLKAYAKKRRSVN